MSSYDPAALGRLLAATEVRLASASEGSDAHLEATIALGRLAAAAGEPRAGGLLLAAVDAADALGREDLGRAAIVALGRNLVRSNDVVLGRGNLERGLGEAQRAGDRLVQAHVAEAALGLVEAWLADDDLERALSTLTLIPRETPERCLAEARLEEARGKAADAARALQRGLELSARVQDEVSRTCRQVELARALARVSAPSAGDRLARLGEGPLRAGLQAVSSICAAPNDPWIAAADAIRGLQRANGVELVVSGHRVQSPAGAQVEPTRSLVRGEVQAQLMGGQEDPSADFLTELLLDLCRRMTAPAQLASERVLDMLDRLLESDLEGPAFFELATQLAVDATGAARGRLIRLDDQSPAPGDGATFVSRSLLRHVALTGRPLLLEDASDAPPVAVSESVGEKGLRSVLAAPLTSRRGRVLAVLYLDDPGAAGRFGPAELAVVTGFAARLGPQLESELRAQLRARAPATGIESLLPAKSLEAARASDHPLLISGEPGVGKEFCARAIHGQSGRREQPFVVVSCGSLASELLDSELFGHEEGAFTGAHAKRLGLFQRANGGVLFFDGLQDAAPRLQAELLRAVESGEIRPLGGSTERVDVRVMASYAGDPTQGVQEGRLRQDLFYRLSVLQIQLPPLRERMDELDGLVRAILTKLGEGGREVTPKAFARLRKHTWPGNLRELQATLERALVAAGSDSLRASHFQLETPLARKSAGGEAINLNPRQLHVANTLLPGQTLRNADHAAAWNVSPATAWRDLIGLVKAGLLESEGKGRGAIYRAKSRP